MKFKNSFKLKINSKKSFIIGTVFGFALSATTAVFAEDGIKTVQALIRNDLPIIVQGEKASLDNPVLSYNDRTYLSLRDLGKILGANISYNANTRSVEVGSSQISRLNNLESESNNSIGTKNTISSNVVENTDYPLSVSIDGIEFLSLDKIRTNHPGYKFSYFPIENTFRNDITNIQYQIDNKSVDIHDKTSNGFFYKNHLFISEKIITQ